MQPDSVGKDLLNGILRGTLIAAFKNRIRYIGDIESRPPTRDDSRAPVTRTGMLEKPSANPTSWSRSTGRSENKREYLDHITVNFVLDEVCLPQLLRLVYPYERYRNAPLQLLPSCCLRHERLECLCAVHRTTVPHWPSGSKIQGS